MDGVALTSGLTSLQPLEPGRGGDRCTPDPNVGRILEQADFQGSTKDRVGRPNHKRRLGPHPSVERPIHPLAVERPGVQPENLDATHDPFQRQRGGTGQDLRIERDRQVEVEMADTDLLGVRPRMLVA